MSLINQLLKDLEKRHADATEVNGLAPQARSLPDRQVRLARPIGVLALGAALGFAAVAAYQWRGLPLRSEPMPVAPPARMASKETAIVRVPASEPPPKETAVQAALLTPVFQLSDELSVVPEPREAPAPPSAEQTDTPKTQSRPAPHERVKRAQTAKAERKAPPAPAAAAVPEPTTPSAEADSSARPAAPAVPKAPGDSAPVETVVIDADLPPAPIEKRARELTAYERAENEFRTGVARLRQGRLEDAEASFRAALREDRSHVSARQALIGLLIESHRNADAEAVLREALSVNPRQPRHAMLLARLELERGDATAAADTLEAVKPYAGADAEYLSFYAAALQRAGRYVQSADLYRSALAVSPGNAVWLMGLGISLRGAGQRADAREAFHQAAQSNTLSPELQRFVEAQYQELTASKR